MQLQETLSSLSKNEFLAGMWRLGDLRYKLHIEQRKYDEFVDQSDYVINVFHCSRGLGKTWYFIYKCMSYAIQNPGARIVYFTKSRKTARDIFLPTFKLFIADAPADLFNWSEYHHRVKFTNGSEIILEGAEDDDDKLRGPYAHMIVCDEAGFWSNLQYAVVDIFMDQVRRRDGKIFITTTTPSTPGHEFYYFKSIALKHNTYYTLDSRQNPFITNLDSVAETYGGWQAVGFRREHLNEDIIDPTRAVVPEFNRKRHVVVDYQRPPLFDCYTYLDLGYERDPTHILFCYYDYGKAQLIVEDELTFDHATSDKVAAAILAKEVELWGAKKPTHRVSDNDAQQIADFAHIYGLECMPAMKYDKEVVINNLKTRFGQDKILIHQRCTQLIFQLEVGIWNRARTDYERIPGAGHLDGVDALRYGVRILDWTKNPVPLNYGIHLETHNIRPQTTGNYRKALQRYGIVRK